MMVSTRNWVYLIIISRVFLFLFYWAFPIILMCFGIYFLIFFEPDISMLEKYGTSGLSVIGAILLLFGASMYKPGKVIRKGSV